MATSEWIAIVSVSVLIIGWFLNSALNRKNEIAKERLKFRLEILMSILDVFNEAQRLTVISGKAEMNNKEYTAEIIKALSRLALFGKKDEIALSQTVFVQIQRKEPIGKELTQLMELVRDRIKTELKI